MIAYPTETLYGLGGPPTKEVVRRVFEIKGRPEDKPLPLIVADEEMAQETALIPAVGLELAKIFWPGPLTLVLTAKPGLPEGVVREGKVALRVSSHDLAQALSRHLNAPLISTSANRSGRPGLITSDRVQEELIDPGPDLILAQDPCPGGPGSTIVDLTLTPPRILREGAIETKELSQFIKGFA